jgi:hypothetical protein
MSFKLADHCNPSAGGIEWTDESGSEPILLYGAREVNQF